MSQQRPAGGTVSDEELQGLRLLVEGDLPGFLDDLATLVNIDSGSYTKPGVDRVARWVARFLEELGASVELLPDEELGDTVIGRIDPPVPTAETATPPRLLLIGHLDTVFEAGTADARPFRTAEGRAHGPGVTDMKSGLLTGLYALRALRALLGTEGTLLPPIIFIGNPDEEIGSPLSTPIIVEAARTSDACLVLEAARANGDIVSARKGILEVELRFRGRAAHAGIEPKKGRSAVLEAAHKTIALHALPERLPGVTCNVGLVRGGTRPNVVAEEAILQVDVRSPTRSGLEAAEAELRRICARSAVAEVSCKIVEKARHWPMEKGAATTALVELTRGLAARLGFALDDAATGGASDANTTAGLGLPTLDGLGPVGGNDHAPTEYLELDSIVPRVTLLAALLLALARDPALTRQPAPTEESSS